MKKPWIAQYLPGVSEEIDPNTYTTLLDLFDQSVAQHPDVVAFTNMKATLTYRELYNHSVNFAAYLQSTGLEKGARVGIVMPNLLQYTVALFGILRAGMVVVNINPLYTAPEMSHQLNDSGAQGIIVIANFAATVQQVLPNVPSLKEIIVTEIGDMMGTLRGGLVSFIVKHIKKMVPNFNIPQAVSFKQALKKGQHLPLQPVDIVPEDLAFLQYTGGTTGVPKAAMLTHRNMISNVLQVASWTAPMVNKDDVVLAALPMYHIFSLTVCCLTFLSAGAHCLLVTNPRHMPSFLKILKRSKVTVFVGLNTLFNAVMQQPAFKSLDFSKLSLTISGGMALQQVVAEHWQALTGCAIIEGYGLTETSPVLTINTITNKHFSGSIGLPISSTEVTIKDDQNRDLGVNEVGEICAKGPQVMAGYYNRPDETRKVIDSEGWLHTGDIGRMTEDGHFYIVDRKKDMILVSGFNVYPNEIEDVLAKCEGVLEVAVVGVPNKERGETIKAFIVTDGSPLTSADVITYCRKYLTRYKIPKQVEFRDELPKSNVGKILRRALKEDSVVSS